MAPEGELIADDVQAALVDVYGRTSALARLEDLRVAYELVDDFAPSADGGSAGQPRLDAGHRRRRRRGGEQPRRRAASCG